jgi:hypothetical protein
MADRIPGAYNIAHLREPALLQVPQGLSEFVDRGTEDAVALRDNRVAFEFATSGPAARAKPSLTLLDSSRAVEEG